MKITILISSPFKKSKQLNLHKMPFIGYIPIILNYTNDNKPKPFFNCFKTSLFSN